MSRGCAILVLVLCGSPALDLLAQQSRSKPSRDWKTLSASGLEVVGNAREADLRRAVREIAAFKSTLQALIPGIQLSSPEPTTLVVFRDHPSFTEFAPRDGRGRRQLNVGGYFADTPDRNYMVLPVFADRETTYRTVFHEYTHYVVSRNFRDVPLWLNEGLAEFYSTFEIDHEGRAIVGKAPQSRVWTLRNERLPPLRRLLSGETIPRNFQSPDTAVFYAQSWLFVHFMTLSEGGKRQGQVVRYLELLPQTKSAEAAAREAFGTTLEALEQEIIRYSERFTLPAIRVSGISTEMSQETATPLMEADVAELKARLLLELNVPAEAARYVTRALELEPAHRGARLARARADLDEDRFDAALSALETLAHDEPQNFTGQYYLGRVLYEVDRYGDAIAAFNRALKINPKASAPWFQLSLAAMALGEYEQSDSAMAQLQELYSAPKWHYMRAIEALKIARHDAALGDARAFIERAGAGDDSAPYAAFIGVIAARRLQRENDAKALLDRIIPALPPRSWPLTVAQFMQGALAPDDFLDKARDNGQRTEARTYIALHLLRKGELDAAKEHLRWVKDKGDRNYTEYELAVAELKRLDSAQ